MVVSSTQLAQGWKSEYLFMQSAFCLKNELMSKCEWDLHMHFYFTSSTMHLLKSASSASF